MNVNFKPCFTYNFKTGNIEYNLGRGVYRIVRYEKSCDSIYYWYKDKGCKWYLRDWELSDLARTAKWLIEQHGCDFGEEINALAYSPYTKEAV